MEAALARLERLEVALGPSQDAKQLKESVLKAQADLAALEKQYPPLAELVTKHGAQSKAILSGIRPISIAGKTQLVLGKEDELRASSEQLQAVQTLEQYLSSDQLQPLCAASGTALTLADTHSGQQLQTDQISTQLQQRLLAYNELVMAVSLKFAQLDAHLQMLEQRVSEIESKRV